jgi:hypothetical protein
MALDPARPIEVDVRVLPDQGKLARLRLDLARAEQAQDGPRFRRARGQAPLRQPLSPRPPPVSVADSERALKLLARLVQPPVHGADGDTHRMRDRGSRLVLEVGEHQCVAQGGVEPRQRSLKSA